MRIAIPLLALALLAACGRPPFEQFETRISTTVTNPTTKRPTVDPDTGKARQYSAVVKVYINNTDGSVNFELSKPDPASLMNCEECRAALFAEAARVTEAAYPHLAPLKVR